MLVNIHLLKKYSYYYVKMFNSDVKDFIKHKKDDYWKKFDDNEEEKLTTKEKIIKSMFDQKILELEIEQEKKEFKKNYSELEKIELYKKWEPDFLKDYENFEIRKLKKRCLNKFVANFYETDLNHVVLTFNDKQENQYVWNDGGIAAKKCKKLNHNPEICECKKFKLKKVTTEQARDLKFCNYEFSKFIKKLKEKYKLDFKWFVVPEIQKGKEWKAWYKTGLKWTYNKKRKKLVRIWDKKNCVGKEPEPRNFWHFHLVFDRKITIHDGFCKIGIKTKKGKILSCSKCNAEIGKIWRLGFVSSQLTEQKAYKFKFKKNYQIDTPEKLVKYLGKYVGKTFGELKKNGQKVRSYRFSNNCTLKLEKAKILILKTDYLQIEKNEIKKKELEWKLKNKKIDELDYVIEIDTMEKNESLYEMVKWNFEHLKNLSEFEKIKDGFGNYQKIFFDLLKNSSHELIKEITEKGTVFTKKIHFKNFELWNGNTRKIYYFYFKEKDKIEWVLNYFYYNLNQVKIENLELLEKIRVENMCNFNDGITSWNWGIDHLETVINKKSWVKFTDKLIFNENGKLEYEKEY